MGRRLQRRPARLLIGDPLQEKPEDRRTRHVQEFLHQHLAPVMRLDLFPPDTWTGSPFGWDPPYQHEGLFVLRYCPDIIANHTADLFVDDCDDYLRAVVSCALLHVIHQDVPAEQRVAVVEGALYDTAPGTIAVLSRVQMAALDK